jgi:hypothetical protein
MLIKQQKTIDPMLEPGSYLTNKQVADAWMCLHQQISVAVMEWWSTFVLDLQIALTYFVVREFPGLKGG